MTAYFHTHFRTLRSALRALRRNVMRSALTCLGIIIGVAAVIATMEIGQGSSAAIQRNITSMGANTVLVLPGAATNSGINWGAGSILTLTPYDCDAILRLCPAVKNACPIVRSRSAQVIYGNRNCNPGTIQGVTSAFLAIRDWEDMADGEAFTDREVRNASKVCLIGKTVADELFDGQSPVGKDIRINNVSLRVIGVLRAKGANMMGFDQDDLVLLPWTTVKYRLSGQSYGSAATISTASGASTSTINSLSALYPDTALDLFPAVDALASVDRPQPVRFINVDQIMCEATSGATTGAAMQQITALLHLRHRIGGDDPDDFNLRDMGELTNMLTGTTKLMTNLLLSVAAISLLVGGVGIMNIMLVSVTERTREIGLRMAVGARGRDILRQFLIEATVLCLLGGILGIVLGRGSSILLRLFGHLPTQISVPAIIISVAVSAAVGVIFGYYPAWKASRLDPIEALRYE
jgi:ABC-type antimicrobial peptide transport system permease subunit